MIKDYIRFYRVNEDFGFLSNFAPYRIFASGKNWPTSEHYFQSEKFNDESIKEKIRQIESPMKAAEEGREKRNPLRADWEVVKDQKMMDAIRFKFMQHHDLKVKLLDTGDKMLIEHTVNDSYWGDGGDGSGKNMLGASLMELRAELKSLSPAEWVFPPWLAFPDVNESDMFWRMGLGESYMYTWVMWFNAQPLIIQDAYKTRFAPNEEWSGFYD